MKILTSTRPKAIGKMARDILPVDQFSLFQGAHKVCLETGKNQLMQMVIKERTWLFRFTCRKDDMLVQEAELTDPDTKDELIRLMELGVKNYERSQRKA